MNTKQNRSIFYALLAALLYAISSPCSKLLLEKIPPTVMAGLLYLGAGVGMAIVGWIQKRKVGFQDKKTEQKEAKLTKKELPFILAMIVLDVAAPIFLMMGLEQTTAANVSLLNNFEIVATSLIALLLFKEMIGKRLWLALLFILTGSILLSFEGTEAFVLNAGSLLVLAACVCWGFENNCTRMISSKNPVDIVILKGFGSGVSALLIAFFLGEPFPSFFLCVLVMLLGFFAYGLSITCYLYAQRELGAARTSTYYAFAPFLGVALSFLFLQEQVNDLFFAALFFMIAGAYFAATEVHAHQHKHVPLSHDHFHSHGGRQDDFHHQDHLHSHMSGFIGEHSHPHKHQPIKHKHRHVFDIHHAHKHDTHKS